MSNTEKIVKLKKHEKAQQKKLHHVFELSTQKKRIYWKLKHIYREWTAQAPICGLLDKLSIVALPFLYSNSFHRYLTIYAMKHVFSMKHQMNIKEYWNWLNIITIYIDSKQNITRFPQFHATSKIYCLFAFFPLCIFRRR